MPPFVMVKDSGQIALVHFLAASLASVEMAALGRRFAGYSFAYVA